MYWDGKCDLVLNNFFELLLLLREVIKCSFVLVGVSLFDAHGMFSFGINVDYVVVLIGEVLFFFEVNVYMLRMLG